MINSHSSVNVKLFEWFILSIAFFAISFPLFAQETESNQTTQSDSNEQSIVEQSSQESALNSSEEADFAFVDFLERSSEGVESIFTGIGQVCTAIQEEISLIEGDNFDERWDWIEQRVRTDPVGRTNWILILVLFVSSFLFVLLLFYGFLTRKRKKKLQKSQALISPADIQKELVLVPPTVSPSKTFIQQLRAGEFEEVEKKLLQELAKHPGDETVIMYLFACRAVKLDVSAYKNIIQQILPTGLDPNQQLCAHIAQIGRILATSQFSLEQYPDPKQEFKVDPNKILKSMEAISELGDVQTLLELVRIYIGKGELDNSKHLIVEVLVRGNFRQRQRALEFARAFAD